MEKRQTLRQATKLWQEAYRYQMEVELDRAIEGYQRSIEAHPKPRRIPSWGGP